MIDWLRSVFTWPDLIAGAYVALWLVVLCTAFITTADYMRERSRMTFITATLFLAFAVSHLGHWLDQSLWMVSNVERAFADGKQLHVSAWYVEHIPAAPLLTKLLPSLGALIGIYVARVHRKGISLRKWLVLTSIIWFAVVLTVAAIT